MYKNRSQGFTLIELLVVIAIIGILSSVVLASLNTARNKGNDAKIQTQMQAFQTAAETYYSSNGNYGTATSVCNQSSGDAYGLYNLMQAANWPNATAPTCTVDGNPATKWSAYHVLAASTEVWCVDSTGQSKKEPAGWTAPTGGNPCP